MSFSFIFFQSLVSVSNLPQAVRLEKSRGEGESSPSDRLPFEGNLNNLQIIYAIE